MKALFMPKEIKPLHNKNLNLWQHITLLTYDHGEFAHLAEIPEVEELNNQLNQCGDGLLRFMIAELSSKEDCTTNNDAIHRMIMARTQINEVIQQLQNVSHLRKSPQGGF